MALVSILFFSAGCYCPLLAKAGYEDECEGYMVDNLDGRQYRLSAISHGQSIKHSVTLNISRKDCSIPLSKDLEAMGVIGLRIEKARSAKQGAMVITIRDKDDKGKNMECKAPLSDTDPMVFSCPAKAGDIRYLLTPQS